MTARILVVDDIQANLRLLEARLRAEYYEVRLASSGQQALREAAAWRPDIVLLDVMMPGLDGYETCRRLKADRETAHVPVVMVTALTDQAERVQGLEAGADDFLSKPVDDATLFARLRALMRSKQVEDAWRLRAETARGLGFETPPPIGRDISGAQALVVVGRAGDLAAAHDALGAEGVAVLQGEGEADLAVRLGDAAVELVIIGLGEDPAAGLRIASRLRAAEGHRDIPLLLLGDAAQRREVLRGLEIGANDHAFRPLDPAELRARARNQIRRRRTQERLRLDLDRSLEMAVTDSLTGLRNRRFALRQLEVLLRNAPTAVLMLDVDHFKRVNDTRGHASGDAVLIEVAARLRAHLRAADVIARVGGEEFLIALSGAAGEDAAAVADRLRMTIAATPVAVGEQPVPVTVSIGVARMPVGGSVDAALAAADAALYAAKAAGRNCVRWAPEAPAAAT
jgi:two-component system cell cycle response regulator